MKSQWEMDQENRERFWRPITPNPPKANSNIITPTCTFPTCTDEATDGNYCEQHYKEAIERQRNRNR